MSDLRDLTPLINPKSVAVVGATPDQNRVGGRPLAFLRRYGFAGPIYLINPKYDQVDGERYYPSVADLPEAPDMAVIAVPAAIVLDTVRDCQARGIPALTIYTSGFGEMGDAGRDAQAELQALAAEKGTLICGPNCQGVANLNDRMVANFSSTLGRDDMAVAPGTISFISQSGLFTGILGAECHARGLGVGYLISSGNEAVVDFADLIAHTAKDPRIKVVAGYLEGVRDGRKLIAAARRAREFGKPVVILKVGRSADSAAAAASHTGSLAGSYEIYRAAFREAGVIEAHDLNELYDLAELFSQAPPRPSGRKVGILTNSGGIGVYCADKVRALGLDMAQYSDATMDAIKARLPEFGSARNPVDITLQALTDPQAVGAHLRHVVADPDVDAVLASFGVQMLQVEPLVEQIKSARVESAKPLVVSWINGDPAGPAGLRAAGIPCYDDPLRALTALRALMTAAEPLRSAAASVAPAAADPVITDITAKGPAVLGEDDGKRLLAAIGIPVTKSILAATAAAAETAAEDIGFPVALKIDSPDIPHKSDAGGVALGLNTRSEVTAAFERIVANVRRHAPTAAINGVGVHQMVTGGVELIAGIKRDPVFGPVIVVGSGGIMVEIFNDVAMRLAPIDADGAAEMLAELRGYPLLTGVRGRPTCDVAAIADVLSRLSVFAAETEALAELDVNPLMALPDGAIAADALVRFGGDYSSDDSE